MDAVRVDKWLWAARFFKTRGLAVDAIKGGRVQLNGRPVKPSRDVAPGDRLEIAMGATRLTVDVRAVSERRGPATEAARLYDETAESRAQRERAAEQRRLDRATQPAYDDRAGRPTKRDRRRLDRTRGR
jgi:ribosome-associated heat shock protein Hsp15